MMIPRANTLMQRAQRQRQRQRQHRHCQQQQQGGDRPSTSEGDGDRVAAHSRPRQQDRRQRQRRQRPASFSSSSTPTGTSAIISSLHGSSRYMVCGVVLFCLFQVGIWMALDGLIMEDDSDNIDDIDDQHDDWKLSPSLDYYDYDSTRQKKSMGRLLFLVIRRLLTIPYACWKWLAFSTSSSKRRRLYYEEAEYFDHQQPHVKPILIVGGSDGSGTRAVVDTLRELGAMIVADDSETFDLHASQLYQHQGWPGLVHAVLTETHGRVHYNYDNDYDDDHDENAMDGEDGDAAAAAKRNSAFRPSVRQIIDREVGDKLRVELKSKFELARRFYRNQYISRRMKQEEEESESDRMGSGSSSNNRRPLGSMRRPGYGPPPPPRRMSPLEEAMRHGKGARPTMFAALAKDIAYVVKAPVTMLLLPILTRHLAVPSLRRQSGNYNNNKNNNNNGPRPRIKFLHVVRDGRDIALSNNQSPVLKFYNVTYPDDFEERLQHFSGPLEHVRGIQLWNDWNTQVWQWASSYASNPNAAIHLEYLWIRSEDLLPDSVNRRECLQALADFVGSTLSSNELCCLSRQTAHDFGKSVIHNADTLQQQEHQMQHHQQGQDGSHGIIDRWKQQDKDHQLRQRGPPHRGQQRRPRRRLMQKLVPTSFLRDYEGWKTIVQNTLNTNLSDTKLLVVQGLIGHGEDLVQSFELNKDALLAMDPVPVVQDDIRDLIDDLRMHQQEARTLKFHRQQDARPGHTNVTQRYGKWQSANATLLECFHREGKIGLEQFGYHPERTIHYPTSVSFDSMSCNDTVLCPHEQQQ